jgi:hypothetical protein
VDSDRGLQWKREAVGLIAQAKGEMRGPAAALDERRDLAMAEEVVVQQQRSAGRPPGARVEVQEHHRLDVELDVSLVERAAPERIGQADPPAREHAEHPGAVLPIVVVAEHRDAEAASDEQSDLLSPVGERERGGWQVGARFGWNRERHECDSSDSSLARAGLRAAERAKALAPAERQCAACRARCRVLGRLVRRLEATLSEGGGDRRAAGGSSTAPALEKKGWRNRGRWIPPRFRARRIGRQSNHSSSQPQRITVYAAEMEIIGAEELAKIPAEPPRRPDRLPGLRFSRSISKRLIVTQDPNARLALGETEQVSGRVEAPGSEVKVWVHEDQAIPLENYLR